MKDAKMVLEERARRLARVVVNESHDDATSGLAALMVRAADQAFLLTTDAVVSVSRASVITPLPHAVAPVVGLAAWRSRPLTVMSFGSIGGDELRNRRMIVLGDERRAFGALLVDDVDDMVRVNRAALTPHESGALAPFAIGVTADARVVLDSARLLAALKSPADSAPSN